MVAEVGRDDEVRVPELSVFGGGHHDGCGLIRNIYHGFQFVLRPELCEYVDRDDEVRAHLAEHIHRNGIEEAAVHEPLAISLHRGEEERYCCARLDRLG